MVLWFTSLAVAALADRRDGGREAFSGTTKRRAKTPTIKVRSRYRSSTGSSGSSSRTSSSSRSSSPSWTSHPSHGRSGPAEQDDPHVDRYRWTTGKICGRYLAYVKTFHPWDYEPGMEISYESPSADLEDYCSSEYWKLVKADAERMGRRVREQHKLFLSMTT